VNATPTLRPPSPAEAPPDMLASPGLPLDARQRLLLSLLLNGHTDISAAQRLGVSPRTVSNILRGLMDLLGVDNRFQLGVALGTRMRSHSPCHSPAHAHAHAHGGTARLPLPNPRG
jgi:DNA-binding NarL/FixJ family response regulator